ncbi:MAG TPA: aldehyde dehydrogenase [Taishania sp.]|nr:aldehyde dehydrogenase [Taishania sp.]
MNQFSELVNKQQQFFKRNHTKSIAFRIEQLKKLKHVIQSHETLLNDAIKKDFHKSEFDTYSNELGLIYHDINEAIKKVKRWSRIKRVRTNLVNFPAKSYIIPEPLGVSLVIGAWNYPYQLSFAPVVAAMAAGCTIILKPSELPIHTSQIMQQIVRDNFSEDYFAVVEGGIEETTALLKQRFDKIFFTGSTKVGRIVYEAAAKNLTPVTLELGGKSPVFVTESCNLKMTARRLVWAKFLNAGQTCIAPDYAIVHEKIHDQFLEAVVTEIKKSDYKLSNNNYVQIINQRNFDRLTKLIQSEQVYFGGTCHPEDRTIEPTILKGIRFEDPIMQEEIFGPILPVIAYKNIQDAIDYVKSGEKPLSCYIYSSNRKEIKQVLNEVSFGGGCVNESIMHITNSKLPFGGVGASGIGSYHGEAGFNTFSHFKSILDKPTWFELSLKYSPLTKRKLDFVKKLL